MGYNDIIERGDVGSLIPEQVVPEIMQGATQQSVFLANARALPGMVRGQETLNILAALPSVSVGDSDTTLIQTTEQTWTNKYIYAKPLQCIVPIPKFVLNDSAYDIWGEIKPRLIEALALSLDRLVHFGSDLAGNAAPASWPDDMYTAAVAASNEVVLGTGVDLYEDLLGDSGVIAKLEAEGFLPTAYLGSLNMRGKLRNCRTSTGEPIFRQGMTGGTQYTLDGSPIVFPEDSHFQSATTGVYLLAAAYRQFVYAWRQDAEFEIIKEGVITNNAGQVLFNFHQQNMVGLKMVARWGWQCPNPINRVQGTEASRYPVAVLTVS